jgi:hypothetical protein
MIQQRLKSRPMSPWVLTHWVQRSTSARLLLWGVLCVGASGCNASRYSERFGLGTIDRQKAKAAEFDPYPLNDIGPSVVGGRPPGFFNPLAEPRRNELMGRTPTYGASPATR